MKQQTLFLAAGLALLPLSNAFACPELLDVKVRPLAGEKAVHLCDTYKNNVVLVVNTASKCGFTPQYDGLEALYSQYKEQGLVVLGFPSNDFGAQEPGSEKQIQKFCRLTYGVKFPMFTKTTVRPHNAGALYRKLANAAGEYPQWNFHKYLIDRDGKLVRSFRSETSPTSPELVNEIKRLL